MYPVARKKGAFLKQSVKNKKGRTRLGDKRALKRINETRGHQFQKKNLKIKKKIRKNPASWRVRWNKLLPRDNMPCVREIEGGK